jgi:Flp pilus assembly protein TadG
MRRMTLRCYQAASHAVLGSAAIEFAIFAPLLLTLVFGGAEAGYSAYQAMQVQNAVEAGAVYTSKYGWNSSGITAAVVNATDVTGLTATPAPAQFWGCPASNNVVVVANGVKCANGNSAGQYVQINATLSRQSLIPNSGLPLPATFTAQSIVRLN